MTALWKRPETIAEVQPGGPGNPYKVLGFVQDNDTIIGAASGGGQAFDTDWSRDLTAGAGQPIAVGTHTTGNPDPWTFQLQKRLHLPLEYTGVDALRRLFGCLHNLRIRAGCNDIAVKSNFISMELFNYVNGTGYSDDSNLSDGMTNDSTPVLLQVDERAVNRISVNKVNLVNIQGTVSDFDINDIISVGVFNCAGVCGTANDGDQDFWFVTDRDNTPGYLSQPTPIFNWTTDGGQNWAETPSSIGVFQNSDAVGVAKSGAYVVVVSNTASSGSFAYALFEDIKNGVSAPWALATGGVAAKEAQAIAALGSLIWAVGKGGHIYRSTDGPFAFTVYNAGALTAQNYNAVAIADENLAYFAGNSGVVAKYDNNVLSLLTLTNSSGATVTTANINTIAVPPGAARGNEVYIGTADGKVFRSRSKGAAGTWEELAFDKSGTGSIKKIVFSKPDGVFMWVLQFDVGATVSRVLLDRSGGAMGQDVEPLGNFTGNAGLNSIATSSPVVALTVGQISNSYGYIGKIS